MALPSIQVMHELMPNADIDLIVQKFYIKLMLRDELRECIPLERKKKGRFRRFVQRLRYARRQRYDVVVDCSFGSNSAATFAIFSGGRTRVGVVRPELRDCFHINPPMHAHDLPIRERWPSYVEAVGRPGLAKPARITLMEEEESLARTWYTDRGFDNQDKRVLFIPPGGRASADRDWPLHRFIEVSHALATQGHRIVFMLGPEEEHLLAQLEKDGPEGCVIPEGRGMRNDAALMSLVDLYIGCDCGSTHLAKAVGAPILLIQRHEDSFVWSPDRSEDRAFFDPGTQPARPIGELVDMALDMIGERAGDEFGPSR